MNESDTVYYYLWWRFKMVQIRIF